MVQDDESIPSPVSREFVPRVWQNVRLGPLRVAIRANETPFGDLHYFPKSTWLPREAAVDWTVNCCNLSIDGPWPLQELQNTGDRTYRGNRFAAGYYLTDHFGPPAYLLTRGSQLWIFAERFEPILWPFVVKFLLTAYSIDRRMLHLKAAAISLDETATLIVGRGGTGKTVLLTQLCQKAGARFLANTHVLVHDEAVIPVASSMRVRDDLVFGPLILGRNLPSAVKRGEFLADPFADLGWTPGGTETPIRNICLLDYRGDGRRMIHELDRDLLFNYMETFSLALNIYGLREDVLDYLDGDVNRFSVEWSRTKSELRTLISRCRCHYVSCDVTEFENLSAIRALLNGNSPPIA